MESITAWLSGIPLRFSSVAAPSSGVSWTLVGLSVAFLVYQIVKQFRRQRNKRVNVHVWEGERDARGRPHGKGEMRLGVGGDVYAGDMRHGVRHGRGEYTYAAGTSYKGAFVEGAFDGKGRETYGNGAAYAGEFSGGKRHGHGTLTTPITKKAAAADATSATTKTVSAQTYTGAWRGGLKHGAGVLHAANGELRATNRQWRPPYHTHTYGGVPFFFHNTATCDLHTPCPRLTSRARSLNTKPFCFFLSFLFISFLSRMQARNTRATGCAANWRAPCR
jgi:hypothetical protein